VTHDLEHEIYGFLGLIVEHFYVKIGDPSCIIFTHCADDQTDRQTNAGENLTPRLPPADVMRIKHQL